ncbi:MAG: hypothetical protein AB8H79_02660 [Myxococcota bacterium]
MRTTVMIASLLLATMACNSDPETNDPNDTNDTNDTVADTYECGWAANDPGTLVAGDGSVGTTVGNIEGVDQCGEEYSVWDGHSDYMMVVSPAMW